MLRTRSCWPACWLVLAAAGAFGYAQTQMGQDQIAGLIARQLGEPGRPAEVEGLGGLLPVRHPARRSLRLRDAEGVWLEVEDARLQVRPAALLRGEIAVEAGRRAAVALDRLPPAEPGAAPSRSACRSCPSCRHPAPDRRRPAVRRCAGAGRAGPGRGRDLRPGRRCRHRRRRRSRRSPARAAPDRPAHGRGSTSPPGWICPPARCGSTSRAARPADCSQPRPAVPRRGRCGSRSTGDGPLSDWQGKLAVDAERLAKLDARRRPRLCRAQAVSRHRRAGRGAGRPAARVRRCRRHAAPNSRCGPARPARSATPSRRSSCRTASASLSGNGGADLAADTVAGQPRRCACRTCAASPALAGTPLAGAAELKLTASGAARQPELDLRSTARTCTPRAWPLSRLTGAFAVAFDAPLGEGPVGLRAKGTATAEGLALDGRALADGRLELTLDGELPAQGDAVRPRAGACAPPWARWPATPASIATGWPARRGWTSACRSSRP